MRNLAFFLCLFCPLALRAAEVALNPLSVTCDRADALYGKGDTVRFAIQLKKNEKPGEVKWSVLKNGLFPIDGGTVALKDGRAIVTGRLDEPGFLLCEVTCERDGKPLRALAGAAIAPLEIKPSMPAPPDFDTFWKEQLARLGAVPKNFRLTPVQSPNPGVETFDLQGDCVDAPVSGYFAKPIGANPKRLPAILTTHGAGVWGARLNVAVKWAERGFLALDINAHGLPNGKPEEYYKGLADGELKDYRQRGRDSRETVYFLGMFLRVVRALDFLAEQPEWDGHTLIVYGTSQGGAQAIAGTALDPRVSSFVAGVPAMCDHTGQAAGRAPGWPQIIPKKSTEKAGPRITEAVRYYDMVNFTPRIKVPGFFAVGFIDQTCPPTSVYAAYNNMSGEKKIYNDIAAGHTNTPEAGKLEEQAVWNGIAEQK